MPGTKRTLFDPARFMQAAGVTHNMVQIRPGHVFFSQGGHADTIFFLDSGRAKLTVVSQRGKEATVTMLGPGDFIGEELLASASEVHDATASSSTTAKSASPAPCSSWPSSAGPVNPRPSSRPSLRKNSLT